MEPGPASADRMRLPPAPAGTDALETDGGRAVPAMPDSARAPAGSASGPGGHAIVADEERRGGGGRFPRRGGGCRGS